jgi:cob(I)alamin adenosyltransferase
MPIYTRAGDQGHTSLLGGVRMPKDAALLEVCGSLDELNALLGLARSELPHEHLGELLEFVQRQLFVFGAQLVADTSGQAATTTIGSEDVLALEQAIDQLEDVLAPTTAFILPAGCRAAATLHLARAVCRRTERRLASLARSQPHDDSADLLAYINRLGDLLFVLARAANSRAGIADTTC